MNYIKRGFDASVSSIKKHWVLFVVLFVILTVIQFVFIITMAFSGLHYHSVLFEDLQNVVVPMQQMDFTPEFVQTGEFTQILEVYKSFNSLKDNAYRFLVQSALLFLAFNCVLWLGIHMLNGEKARIFFRDRKLMVDKIAQFIASSTVGLLIVYGIGYFFLVQAFSLSTDENVFGNTIKILGVLMGVVYYFLAVGYVFIGKSWKELTASYYKIGVKQFHKVLAIVVINAAVVAISALAVYYTMSSEYLFWLVIPSTLLLSAVLVLIKVYWVNTVSEIVK